MAGITLAQAQAKLTSSMAAYDSALSAQSYSIGSRSKANANLDALERAVNFWEAKVKELTRGGRAIKGITPC